MANKFIHLGKFSHSIYALHAANRNRLTIAGLQDFNGLLLGENRNAFNAASDRRCFTGTAFLQEKKGKAFGNYVEAETVMGGNTTHVIVKVRKDLVGLSDRILFLRQGLFRETELMPLKDGKGAPLESLEGRKEIFVEPSSVHKAIFARRRQGLEFTLNDKEPLVLFTSDDAAFGLTARCRDFFGGRGVVAATVVPSSDQLFVFGYTLPIQSYFGISARKSAVG